MNLKNIIEREIRRLLREADEDDDLSGATSVGGVPDVGNWVAQATPEQLRSTMQLLANIAAREDLKPYAKKIVENPDALKLWTKHEADPNFGGYANVQKLAQLIGLDPKSSEKVAIAGGAAALLKDIFIEQMGMKGPLAQAYAVGDDSAVAGGEEKEVDIPPPLSVKPKKTFKIKGTGSVYQKCERVAIPIQKAAYDIVTQYEDQFEIEGGVNLERIKERLSDKKIGNTTLSVINAVANENFTYDKKGYAKACLLNKAEVDAIVSAINTNKEFALSAIVDLSRGKLAENKNNLLRKMIIQEVYRTLVK